ncbi:MAG: hypothetical protein JW969_08325 [Spirochaetales bacterium]|nr:hypothetical protein [Spirochaetales bacterium]
MNRLILLLPILFLSVLSCSQYAPEINEFYWQMNLFKDAESGRTYPRLTLFLNPFDNDGFSDLDSFYLLSDSEELYWKIDSTVWTQVTFRDRQWIGTNSITMHDFSDIPEGDYRLLLMDYSGESDEEVFLLQYNANEFRKAVFPVPVFKQTALKLSDEKNPYLLFLYNNSDQYVNSFDIVQGVLDVTHLSTSNDPAVNQPFIAGNFKYYLYRLLPGINQGLMVGPYYFRE